MGVVDAGTGEPLAAIQVADVAVGDVDSSPDGEALAAATVDGLPYVFALDSEQLLDLARTRALRTLTEAEGATYDIDPCPASERSLPSTTEPKPPTSRGERYESEDGLPSSG